MRKLNKLAVSVLAGAMVFGSVITANAETYENNIGPNEQAIIDELHDRGYDESNRYYNLVIEEFEYTPGDITDEAKQNIKDKYDLLRDPGKNGITPTEYVDNARSVAQSLGGDCTGDVEAYLDKDYDNCFIYARFEENGRIVYAKTINGLLKDKVVTFDETDYAIGVNGETADKEMILKSEDTYYLVDERSAIKYEYTGDYKYNGQDILVVDGVWDGTYKTDIKGATISGVSAQTYTGKEITPVISVKYAGKTLAEGTDYKVSYSNNKEIGTATITVTGINAYKGTATKTFEIQAPAVTVSYRTHVQSFGWQSYVSNGAVSGTVGKAKRLEGINITVAGVPNLGIQYTTHCQTYGWLPWSSNGDMSGTEGEAKRLEAIEIKLTGSNAKYYDVYYRVHAQSYGWMGWAKNGAPAGTAGYAKRLEGIEVVVVKKGANPPARADITTATPYVTKTSSSTTVSGDKNTNVLYRTQVQSYGWQAWKYNSAVAGTTGEAKRLESIKINLSNKQYAGGISYRTHIQSIGWESAWKNDGELSGTVGQGKRLEAIQIKLTGEMAKHYDVYYRVSAQSYGWLGWAKNGAEAGTAGLGKRLEAIQIVLVPKGGAAPGSTLGCYVTN